MNIRKATVADAEKIAEVHVESWKTTYKGLIADSYLSQLSVERRKMHWERILNDSSQNEVVFVALNDEGEIVGFSNGGRNRNEEFEQDGELYAIYLLQEYQEKGIGKRLFHAVVESLADAGYKSMMVWVLKGNPAIAFYKAMGGVMIGQKEIMIGEEKHIELAYGWEGR